MKVSQDCVCPECNKPIDLVINSGSEQDREARETIYLENSWKEDKSKEVTIWDRIQISATKMGALEGMK